MKNIKKVKQFQLCFIALLIGFAFLLQSCNNFNTKNNSIATDWESSIPEKQGVDSEYLLKMLKHIKKNNLDIHGIMIVRNDKLVFDFHSFLYPKETLHNVKSVSKSIMSGVVGIALDKGLIDSLNTPVHTYFPEYAFNDNKKTITLRHLLTMTSGLDLYERGPIYIFDSNDWIKSTIAQPMVNKPGEAFRYCTGLTHIMSGILTKTSGMSLLELSQAYLFNPLEINKVKWDKGPKGYNFGGANLYMDINSITKIGYLYLNNGKWRDQQIIPRDWILESTEGKVFIPESTERTMESIVGKVFEIEDVYYGYWWWNVEKIWKVAIGGGGQFIFYNKELNTIFTVTSAGGYNGIETSLMMIRNYIFPAITKSESLQENITVNQELHKLIDEFKNPISEKINEFPEIADNISGTTYFFRDYTDSFADNLESLTLSFNNKQCKFYIKYKDYSLDAFVGLDNIYKISKKNNVALKGSWLNDSTFNIIWQNMDYIYKEEYFIEFQDTDNIIFKIKEEGFWYLEAKGSTKEK